MTVAARPSRLDVVRQHVEHAFGAQVAKRLDMFEDGTFYVTAGGWARLLSWLVDFVVYLFCAFAGFVAFVLATRDSGVSDSVAALTMLGLLAGTPVLCGLVFGNGRALGAMLTGTRLVRVKNGRRIGAGACWAMLVRTVLFPLLLIAFTVGGTVAGSLSRISIDDGATRRLHAAGFLRLDAPSPVDQRR
ncbi:RDD family protein [Lentzea albidocapillata]|uniref:RDD family protein n=1 Tax=Lentzea albidocapillata TaxID=40571 RepID=A0A1W2F8H6_9PSEU|nr:RDD family protein [Lentzea albidocapillata]SMD17898.1 RDD family protein [Lentzea albidocapillata]